MDYLVTTIIIGIVATMMTDLWSYARQPLLGVKPMDYVMVGRWLSWMSRGVFSHESIAASAPIKGERVTGWCAHYLIGISFAGILLALWGLEWVRHPSLGPALLVGVATVTAPLLLLQPGMGAGFAASKTSQPWNTRLHSLITHSVFGIGLYAGGSISSVLYPV